MFGQNIPGGMGLSGDSGGERKRVGVNLATIVDLDDPDEYGRVKCRFITGDEDVEETEWAYVATPFGGTETGFFFHPRIGDVVLLAFEEGDIHAPFVIGSVWWSNADIETELPIEEGNKHDIYLIKTPKGSTVTLSDKDEGEMIEIKSQAGHMFKFDDAENKIVIESASGDGITLDTQQGELIIKCQKFELDAGGNKFTVGPDGTVLDCKPSIDIKTAAFTAEGSGSAALKGAAVNVESSGATIVKGTAVNIN